MKKKESKISNIQLFAIFSEICKKYDIELLDHQKQLLQKLGWKARLNPIVAFRRFQDIIKIATGINGIEKLPIEPMITFLDQYTVEELQAIKTIADNNLKLHDYSLSENPIFKIAVIIGAIYVFFKFLLDKLAGSNSYSELELLIINHSALQNQLVQILITEMKVFLIIGLFIVFLVWIWFLVVVRLREIQGARNICILIDIALEIRNIYCEEI